MTNRPTSERSAFTPPPSRRRFLQAAAAVAAATVITRPKAAAAADAAPVAPAGERLNVAFVGAQGKGQANLSGVAATGLANVVALCDVDSDRLAKAASQFPKARKYADFRKMLEGQKEIDAVVVTTPDNTHAVAAMMAMKLGKHVYCEKPLCHDLYEVRRLTEAAREFKVATQMGNAGHSSEGIRQQVEWLQAGAVGAVKEVHVWTDRPIGFWPQGLTRPKDPAPPPANVDWDLWLGPAPARPYHKSYLPFVWRGWWDFGTGALGDMACHIMDPAAWALDLGSAKSVIVEATSEGMTSESPPKWSVITYQFPARRGPGGEHPPVKLTWYDGGKMPDMVKGLVAPQKYSGNKQYPFKSDGGVVFVGEKRMLLAPHTQPPLLMEDGRMVTGDFAPPDKSIPRSRGHYVDWLEACKGGPAAGSNFDYAGPLSEIVLLGNLALRLGKRIEWDVPALVATNAPEAAALVRREYRKGWEL